jgi:hypothetical protein
MRKLTHSVKNEKRSILEENLLVIPRKISLRFRVYPRKFRVMPEEKRRELIEILDAMIRRLVKIINAKKTKTRIRLRAMTVLNDLIKTSYTMVRDVEIEHLEREITELENQAEQAI